MPESVKLDSARKALEAHAWQEAYEGLASLADADALSGEDLARLGEAAWWSAHPEESLDAFGRAYAAHAAEGDRARAGYVAVRLAAEYEDRAESALSNGWLQRAIRLLEGQPESVAQGFIEFALVQMSFERGAPEEAMQHAVAGTEIGVRLGDRDVQAFGLVAQGAVHVAEARVEQGLSLIDEGVVAAVGGELTPFVAGSIYCVAIGVCRSVADYRRAAQWTEAVGHWCERQRITGFPGVCRVQRAEIMRLRGAFSEAEAEARSASTELEAFGRLPQAGAGSYEVGEVRLRMGDLVGAEEAFTEAHRLGHEPQPGMALLWLARNRIDAARSAILLSLADAMDPFTRVRLLPARVEISLAGHDLAAAREAADELIEITSRFDAPILHAASHQALGEVLTYEERPSDAIRELRKAIRHWREADAPFETALARRALAVAHRAGGDETSAELELRAARSEFERLGARLEVDRCEEMIRASEDRAGRRVVRTFMFTDIVGSTELIQTIGDEAWEDVLRWHDETLRKLVGANGGKVVHATGDGFFASFHDPVAAGSCAVAIQRHLNEHRRAHGFAPQVRIGLHSAEATVIADDYAGLGVHEAARVGALAEGGEIVATASTFEGETLPFGTENAREVQLKGLAQPSRVVTIDWRASR